MHNFFENRLIFINKPINDLNGQNYAEYYKKKKKEVNDTLKEVKFYQGNIYFPYNFNFNDIHNIYEDDKKNLFLNTEDRNKIVAIYDYLNGYINRQNILNIIHTNKSINHLTKSDFLSIFSYSPLFILSSLGDYKYKKIYVDIIYHASEIYKNDTLEFIKKFLSEVDLVDLSLETQDFDKLDFLIIHHSNKESRKEDRESNNNYSDLESSNTYKEGEIFFESGQEGQRLQALKKINPSQAKDEYKKIKKIHRIKKEKFIRTTFKKLSKKEKNKKNEVSSKRAKEYLSKFKKNKPDLNRKYGKLRDYLARNITVDDGTDVYELIDNNYNDYIKKVDNILELATSNDDHEILEKLETIEILDQKSLILLKAFIRYTEKAEKILIEHREEFYRKKETFLQILKIYEEEKPRNYKNFTKEAQELGMHPKTLWFYLDNGEVPKIEDFSIAKSLAKKTGIQKYEALTLLKSDSRSIKSVVHFRNSEFLSKVVEKTNITLQESQSIIELSHEENNLLHVFINNKNGLKDSMVIEAKNQKKSLESYFSKQLKGMQKERKKNKEQTEANNQQISIFSILEKHKEKISTTYKTLYGLNTKIKKYDLKVPKELNNLYAEISRVWELYNSPETKKKYIPAKELNLIETTFERRLALLMNATRKAEEDLQHHFKEADEYFKNIPKPSPDFNISDHATVQNIVNKDSDVEEKEDNEIKIDLQKFADWINSENKNFQKIKPVLEKLKNFNGTQALKIVDDNEFKKKYGKKAANIDFTSAGFRINIRRSSWEKGDGNLVTELKHEGWHAIDASSNYEISKEFFNIAKNISGFDKAIEFLKRENIPERNFAKELFAYYISEDLEHEAPEFCSKIKDILENEKFKEYNNFQEFLDYHSSLFSEKGAKGGLFSSRLDKAKNPAMLHDILNNHEVPQKYTFLFNSKKHEIEEEIAGIKSIKNINVNGVDRELSSAKSALEELTRRFRDPNLMQRKDADEYIEKEILGKMNELADGLKSVAQKIFEYSNPKIGYFQDLIDNTSFLAIADVGSIVSIFFDNIKENYEANREIAKGKAGAALTKGAMSNKFSSMEKSKIDELVNKDKEGLEKELSGKLTPADVMDRIHKSSDEKYIRACLEVLADRGDIDWRDTRIHRALERLGGGVEFIKNDDSDFNKLKDKVKKAFTNIWTEDYFNSIENKNSSAYEDEKQTFLKNTEGINFNNELYSMLSQKRLGTNVNGRKFEAYIDFCIENAFSGPELIFWFILQGVYHGLLTQERVQKIVAGKAGAFPPVEWLVNNQSTDLLMRLAYTFKPDEKTGHMPPSFLDWFYTTVMVDPSVMDRLSIVANNAGSNWDHDWGKVMLASLPTEFYNLYGKQYDTSKMPLKIEAYLNSAMGITLMNTALARNPDETSLKQKQKFLAQQAGYVALNSVLVSGQHNVRAIQLREETLKKSPREEGSYTSRGGKSKSTIEYLRDNLKMFYPISSAFEILHKSISKGNKNTETTRQEFARKFNEDYPGTFNMTPAEITSDKEAKAFFMQISDAVGRVLKNDVNGVLTNKILGATRQVYADDHGGKTHMNDVDYHKGDINSPYINKYGGVL